ncbi:Glutamate receptor 3.7 [Camellia lanceoleosa]|uniref:Glutamate receptor 3.7 n=1 Tax=Camellia lanceoleosa TaxID=1840588 RepID=A0ACC0GK17_9ERIC|nr:Glutamate receptor 3.7 [Camellia lanceoleosa]
MRSVLGNPVWVLIWGLLLSCHVKCQRPEILRIATLLSYNSVIGRVSKVAIETAIADVNADPNILNGTQLKLIMEDTGCNVFLGSVKVFQVLEKEVVAILGTQSSSVAHMISVIANSLQVPLLSFAATDPTLSSSQFPFFLRTTQTDSYQMAAMAELIGYYGWRNVIAIFVDNEYGRNGISALEDELGKKMAKISYKLASQSQINITHITDRLKESKLIGPRVYVVHVNPDSGLAIFSIAKQLQMMTGNYVWLATDWLSANLDSSPQLNGNLVQILQGVVGIRQHIPESSRKNVFLSRWKEFQRKGFVKSDLNTYGLSAYDTVWAVARSLDEFLNDYGNGNLTFSQMHSPILPQKEFKIFNGGTMLLGKLLKSNFTGLTGNIRFDVNRNLVGGGFDIINIKGTGMQKIGYWSNHSGFSVVPPEILNREQKSFSLMNPKLNNVTWPGGKTDKPRGWIAGERERPLIIGVPKRVGFVEFVTENNSSKQIQGYCIDVFDAARELLPYEVHYTLKAFGDGRSNPSYDELVEMVTKDVFDAAIGDIAIVTNRSRHVEFTQPFIDSGLVIVAPIKNMKPGAWVFLQPFTVEMWSMTGAFFVIIGLVIWFLEHRLNNNFRGRPRKQIITICVFGFSTLFRANKQDIVSALGRMVVIVWLFVLMVIKAGYIASLTSILTVQELSSPSITGIEDLISSTWPIGYQAGSFAASFLTENFDIHRSRLVSLGTPEEYERALRKGPRNGGVAAIVDELPYIELFLSKQSDYGIVGHSLTQTGWGFAFQKTSPLAIDMSTAILKLSENGKLEKIHNKWFCKAGCSAKKARQSEPNELPLSSFWGLFILCGIFTLLAGLIYLVQTFFQFVQHKRKHVNPSSASSSLSSESFSARCSHFVSGYFDFLNKKKDTVKKISEHSNNHQSQASCSSA